MNKGQGGWKFDPDKELPIYPLHNTGARFLEGIGATPLRVSKRYANSILWRAFASHMSVTDFVRMKPGGWKAKRNEREALTIARMLDLLVTEVGVQFLECSAGMEVILRRLMSVYMSDTDGNWVLGAQLEELPSDLTAPLHEVIVSDLTTSVKLMASAADAAKTKSGEFDGA